MNNNIETNGQGQNNNLSNTEEQKISPDNNNYINQQQMQNNNINQDEELLKLYIGNNYEKMINQSYSFCTLFFGSYYMFYRKQYKHFIGLLLLQLGYILSYAFLHKALYNVLLLTYRFTCFIIGASFKKTYVDKAKNDINQIINENQNIEEQKNIIKKTGGVDTRVVLVITLVLLFTIISDVIGRFYIIEKERDYEIHFPEDFKENTTIKENSYKVGTYNYYKMNIEYVTNENKCEYEIGGNDEYTGTSNKEVVDKYLKDKYQISVNLETVNYGNTDYFHYFDEKENKDYYIPQTEKTFYIIMSSYKGKETDNKCHEFTEYILKNSRRLK